MQTRAEAWNLLTEWTATDSLRKHALSVEAAMREYARYFHEDEELWGITGLLHDFDYEKYPAPADHPRIGMAYLTEHGWPEAIITAIAGHALYLNVPRVTKLAQTLFAVDELSGLIVAVAYTRPHRTLAEVEPRSVLKKMKDLSFARTVSREDIRLGTEELGVPLEEHIAITLRGIQAAAPALGL